MGDPRSPVLPNDMGKNHPRLIGLTIVPLKVPVT
jgi:hypothetical protein